MFEKPLAPQFSGPAAGAALDRGRRAFDRSGRPPARGPDRRRRGPRRERASGDPARAIGAPRCLAEAREPPGDRRLQGAGRAERARGAGRARRFGGPCWPPPPGTTASASPGPRGAWGSRRPSSCRTTRPRPRCVAAVRSARACCTRAAASRTAWRARRSLARADGARLLHAFDDPEVIAGQATVAAEILHLDPDVVVVPVGGGGWSRAWRSLLRRRGIRIVGAQVAGVDGLRRALRGDGPLPGPPPRRWRTGSRDGARGPAASHRVAVARRRRAGQRGRGGGGGGRSRARRTHRRRRRRRGRRRRAGAGLRSAARGGHDRRQHRRAGPRRAAGARGLVISRRRYHAS